MVSGILHLSQQGLKPAFPSRQTAQFPHGATFEGVTEREVEKIGGDVDFGPKKYHAYPRRIYCRSSLDFFLRYSWVKLRIRNLNHLRIRNLNPPFLFKGLRKGHQELRPGVRFFIARTDFLELKRGSWNWRGRQPSQGMPGYWMLLSSTACHFKWETDQSLQDMCPFISALGFLGEIHGIHRDAFIEFQESWQGLRLAVAWLFLVFWL